MAEEAAAEVTVATVPPVMAAVGRTVADTGNDRLPRPSPLLLPVPVGGRLTEFADQWNLITSDAWVLQTVSEGYRIEFTGRPRLTTVPRWTPVPQDRARQRDLESGLQTLLEKRAIRIVDPPPDDPGFFSTLFLVKKKSGGWRPILNLKRFNRWVRPQKFRMETLRNVMLSLGDTLAAHRMSTASGFPQNPDEGF